MRVDPDFGRRREKKQKRTGFHGLKRYYKSVKSVESVASLLFLALGTVVAGDSRKSKIE
jgi:hypothetical protein